MGHKKTKCLIDSRFLKVLSVKKTDLKDALVLIILDEDKYNQSDKMMLRQIAQQIEKIEPDGIYFPITKDMNVQIFDRAEFKNRDVIVTIKHNQNVSNDVIEAEVSQAFAGAKSISFIYGDVNVEKK